MKLGVLASGRGSNLQALLDAAARNEMQSRVAVVLSDVADAQALSRAREAGVPAYHVPPGTRRARLTPPAARAYVDRLQEHGVELVALAGFMRIIGKTLFRAFPDRIINIHPSLLPSFRGLEGQRQALEAGVRIAGCTVHYVVPEVDAGPIICQAAVPVRPDDTVDSLSSRILRQEHKIYVEAIRLIEQGRVRLEGGRVEFALPASTTEGEIP